MNENSLSFGISFIAHAFVMGILAICYFPVLSDFRPDFVSLLNVEDVAEIETINLFDPEEVKIKPLDLDATDGVEQISFGVTPMATGTATGMGVQQTDMVSEIASATNPIAITTADIGDILARDVLGASRGSLSNDKGFGNRLNRPANSGMNEGSEAAVGRGLAWIVAHQLPNGSWSYSQHRHPDCRGQCKDNLPIDPNSARPQNSFISATAVALLPMLGAGVTHKEGKYRKEVRAGLDYLIKHHQVVPQGVLFCEPQIGTNYQMYHHSISTIVICEAAAMTRDKQLENLAQKAVNYICWAQDPVGGGWRYSPREPGDTSSLAWNFMALKSAQLGNINVPPASIAKIRIFLDSVAKDNGARYDYSPTMPTSNPVFDPNFDGQACTAIGLLAQMYLGWKPDHPGLVQGTDLLLRRKPNPNDLYYSYYATQVMHHYGGEKWEAWNKGMRDALIRTQVTAEGHEKGSWAVGQGTHYECGGRLVATSFALMILEVYYRHLPLYRKNSMSDAFPLD